MSTNSTPGRSLVTRRAIADIVHAATLGSYGVTGFAGNPLGRLLAALGGGEAGLRVRLHGGLDIDLDLTVAYGLPIAEVARQVDSAVRYALRRGIGREVDRLTIHVNGLHYQPGSEPPIEVVAVVAPDAAAVAPGAGPAADGGTAGGSQAGTDAA